MHLNSATGSGSQARSAGGLRHERGGIRPRDFNAGDGQGSPAGVGQGHGLRGARCPHRLRAKRQTADAEACSRTSFAPDRRRHPGSAGDQKSGDTEPEARSPGKSDAKKLEEW